MPKGEKALFLYLNDEKFPGKGGGQVFCSSSGVSEKGWYEFEFEVESRGRHNPMELAYQKMTKYHKYAPEDLHRLEIYLRTSTDSRYPGILIETIDMPDNKRMTLKRRIWLDKGWLVGLAFGNGTFTAKVGYATQIGAKESDKAEK